MKTTECTYTMPCWPVRPRPVAPAPVPRPELGNLEAYRRELRSHCSRVLGSTFEADDAVQETMVRAWRHLDGFEGRAALRTWLYRIATNICRDMLRSSQRRARPLASLADGPPGDGPTGVPSVAVAGTCSVAGAAGSGGVRDRTADPADVALAREALRTAVVAALHHLPPRQRAALILREVLHWHADEIAELLGSTVPAVYSALQRARATLAALDLPAVADRTREPTDPDERGLLARYVDAFEQADLDALVALLRPAPTPAPGDIAVPVRNS